ncbi:hypothetical protein CEN44_00820 [Fischerella muscicola CCMEE 5323]|uniref:Uncharacterized protein n=1 Tax=Fischerella muscicola CCMEE 5323 TaxID=2019572 RepID=A0A2N6K906_FISMU|nr:hypothetical protein CEN44_00820 [Fischerella muscicola CCMEE 5323]
MAWQEGFPTNSLSESRVCGGPQEADGSPNETSFTVKDERGFFSYTPKPSHPYTHFQDIWQKERKFFHLLWFMQLMMAT